MDRADLISRLQKLSRLTIAAGATEAEAALAAEKIAELMREHNISQSEMDIKTEARQCAFDEYKEFGTTAQDWMLCARSIAHVFDCICYQTKDSSDIFETISVKFFGLPADATASVSLLAIVASAMTNECDKYMSGPGRGQGRSGAHSFRTGMAIRLNERIRALKAMPMGSALIVLKKQLVTDEWAKHNIRLGTTRSAPVRNSGAYAAGKAAGSRVDIGGGKLGGASRMIGRS